MSRVQGPTDIHPGLVRRSFASEILRRFPFRRIDKLLLFATLSLNVFGLLMIYSATFTGENSTIFFKKQLVFLVVSIIFMVLIASFDYRKLMPYSRHIYAAVIFLLCIVFLFPPKGGARRWIPLIFTDLQPSELSKLALIIMLATFIADRRMVIDNWREYLFAFGIGALPAFLIFLEPDFGMSFVVLLICFVMLLIGGARIRHLVASALGLIAVFALAVQFNILKTYQLNRLLVFIRPGIDPLRSGYNITQSKIAIGSGQLLGRGLFRGTQTNLRFVPSHHTDFIFSVVGEELGFLGAALLLTLFILLMWRAYKIASTAKEPFGTMVAAGILTMFLIQIVVNIGMTMGIMPTTGITLPFMSYGGSSLFTSYCAIGLLLNIGTHRFTQH